MNLQQTFNSILGGTARIKGEFDAAAANQQRADAFKQRTEAFNKRAEAQAKAQAEMEQERIFKREQKEKLAAFEKALISYNDKRLMERTKGDKERQEKMKMNEQNYINRKAQEYGINVNDSKYAMARIKENQKVKGAKK